MKLKMLGAVLLLSILQTSFAAPPKPANCPSISALQTVGVSVIVKEREGWVGFVQSDNYTTPETWSFMIGAFKAKNKDDAKNKITSAISTFSLDKGPVLFDVNGKESWVCLYKDKFTHIASAMTPPMDVLDSSILHNF